MTHNEHTPRHQVAGGASAEPANRPGTYPSGRAVLWAIALGVLAAIAVAEWLARHLTLTMSI